MTRIQVDYDRGAFSPGKTIFIGNYKVEDAQRGFLWIKRDDDNLDIIWPMNRVIQWEVQELEKEEYDGAPSD